MHTKNIYKDGELTEAATCKQSLQVQIEGRRSVKRSVRFYNLDMILAIGYRVRSHIGMRFRNWATIILAVVPAFSGAYLIRMAAKACTEKIGADAFELMPLSDYNKIRSAARNFLLASEQPPATAAAGSGGYV